MSPHALPPENYAPDRKQTLYGLLESGVAPNGFLPSQPPLDHLPDPYYKPWELLIQDLPALIRAKRIRSEIQKLPILDASHLKTVPEWRRAYVVLTFLAHGYIWGGDHPAEILPPPLTIPLLRVSSHLDLPPVATYASTCLWNFRASSADPTDLNSIRALHTFTGTEDESWFYAVSVAMEAHGATIIPTMLRALRFAAKQHDLPAVARALDDLTLCIRRIHSLLGRMYERCAPEVFYHRIRPFLAGSKNMAAAGLLRGVFYDEGNGKGEWRHLRGGSNGQSSLIQFLDVVLGVEHGASGSSSPDGGKGEKSFHAEVRAYMPAEHRRFLEDVERMGSLRDVVEMCRDGPEQERLREAYRRATEALTEFRNKHLEIVTRYIIIPSRRARMGREGAGTGLAGVSAECVDGRGELTGTGGTALLPFLKQVRDESQRAGCVN